MSRADSKPDMVDLGQVAPVEDVLVDLKRNRQRAYERDLVRYNELKENSREPEELIREVKFRVDYVEGRTSQHDTRDMSNVRLGGRSSPNYSGDCSELRLEVSPLEKGVPIREIGFRGSSPVVGGQLISARVRKFKVEKMTEPVDPNSDEYKAFGNYGRDGERFYIERDYNEKEHALDISILSEDGERKLRTDFRTDFGR